MDRYDQTDPAAFTPEQVRARLAEGWRAVRFEFCFSFLIATIRRQSPIHLTNSWQQRYIRGMGYSLISILLGPWGVPWGPIWTARSVWTNLTGGVDVTDALLEYFEEESSKSLTNSGK